MKGFLDRIPDTLFRYGVGTTLMLWAGALCFLGEDLLALVPAGASVFVLGSLLRDVYKDTKDDNFPPTQGA
jgi:hypothetical protein